MNNTNLYGVSFAQLHNIMCCIMYLFRYSYFLHIILPKIHHIKIFQNSLSLRCKTRKDLDRVAQTWNRFRYKVP